MNTRAPRPRNAPRLARGLAMFNRVIDGDRASVRKALADLRRRLSPHLSSDTMGRLELVLAEVLNNVVKHGAGADAAPAPAKPGATTPEAAPP